MKWKASFAAILTFMLAIFAPAFAAESGAVTEGKQVFAGKKIWLDRKINVTTLTGATTIYKDTRQVLKMDPGGASRNVTLPAVEDCEGFELFIINGADQAENLVIKNAGATTIVTIGQDQAGFVYCDGGAWYGFVFSAAATGYLPATGTVAGATDQNQVFTQGVTTDEILGNSATALTITPLAGASNTIGNALTMAAGAGTGSGAGAVASLTGGAGGVTNAAGGIASLTGGAGGGTGAGAVSRVVGGASGSGATGNGGAAQLTGGAALSTAGNGGAAVITGGVSTSTGTGGAVTITSGASVAAGGTAGSITIDAGDEASGTRGTITIGGTEAGACTVGRTGQTLNLPGTVAFSATPTGDGIAMYKEVSVTNAEMLDLADTPVELIAAPGAGKVIEVQSVVFFFDYTAAYTVTGNDDLDVCYTTEANVILTGEATGFVDATADDMLFCTRVADYSPAKTVAENAAVVLANNSSDFGGGNAANAVRVKISYRIWSTGF